VVLLGLIVKFGFAFAKFASIFVAVGGYALLWGWKFAVGFVLLIFVHELGPLLRGAAARHSTRHGPSSCRSSAPTSRSATRE
jgi:hypothetical protein